MKPGGVKAFFEKVATDEALRAEFIELAAKHGVSIGKDELSDEELAAVAGGIARGTIPLATDLRYYKNRTSILR